MRPEPVIREIEEAVPRFEAEPVLPVALDDPTPPVATSALMLGGVAVLALGFAGLGAGNFVADQFARAAWLGWTTLAVSVGGFGLVGAGLWRELRGLFGLRHVDGLRAAMASGAESRIADAAAAWAREVEPSLLPALRAVNDPDAALALLRAGPGERLRLAADALGRTAAVQVVAGVAAMPSPALDVAMVAWRGVRLVRQVAALYGVRPGLLGTLSLLRRTANSASTVGLVDLAGNTAAHALLSNPLLAHALGNAAAAGVAARRMTVLARATAAACDPVPPA